MKKLISILLIFALLFTFALPVVYAQDNSKIESYLLSALENMHDDDKLQIWIFIYDTVDEALVVQKTYEECGLTKETAKTQEEVDLYLSTYRKIMADMQEAHNKEVFEKMNVADEDVIFFSKLTPSFIIKASKAKVFELAQLEEVASIGVYKLPIYPQPDMLYEARFIELYENAIFSELHEYDELYYHYDENGEIDWALIYECSYNAPPWEYHRIFKDRVFMYGDHYPFSFGYGLYDVKEDKFYDIISDGFDYSKYEDLEEVFESFNLGYLIGDADRDGRLTILDATLIQRLVAGLTDFDDEIIDYYDDTLSEAGFPKFISDFDCDGERTVLDATAIQLKLAKLSK